MNNLTLSFILFSLLLGNYLLDNKIIRPRAENTLITYLPSEIKRFSIEGYSFTKKESFFEWKENADLKISMSDLSRYLEEFSFWEVLDISKEKVDFEVGKFFLFNDKKIEFSKVNKLTGNYIVKVDAPRGAAYLTVRSNREFEGFYKNEAHFGEISGNLSFKNLSFFSGLIKRIWKEGDLVKFTRIINKKEVSVSFVDIQTKPLILDGLSYDFKKISSFREFVQNLKIKKIIPKLDSNSLPLGSFVVKFKKNSYLAEVFLLKNKYFLKVKDLVYEVEKAGDLFLPISSFWQKTPLWLVNFIDKNLKNIKVINLKDKREFTTKVSGENKIQNILNCDEKCLKAIDELLCYLSLCSEKYEALKFSFNKTKEYDFKIVFNNQKEVFFNIKNTLLEVYDPKSNIEFGYIWSMFRNKGIFESL